MLARGRRQPSSDRSRARREFPDPGGRRQGRPRRLAEDRSRWSPRSTCAGVLAAPRCHPCPRTDLAQHAVGAMLGTSPDQLSQRSRRSRAPRSTELGRRSSPASARSARGTSGAMTEAGGPPRPSVSGRSPRKRRRAGGLRSGPEMAARPLACRRAWSAEHARTPEGQAASAAGRDEGRQRMASRSRGRVVTLLGMHVDRQDGRIPQACPRACGPSARRSRRPCVDARGKNKVRPRRTRTANDPARPRSRIGAGPWRPAGRAGWR